MRSHALAVALVLAAAGPAAAQDTLVVGSKRFTESYILGEIAAQAARAAGTRVEHAQGLGNTAIVFAALRSGSVDLYPDYTGTIARELLRIDSADPGSINRALAPLGLGAGIPLGFENTYALAMLESRAGRPGISRIGDIAARPDLRLGLSHEFLERADGWPGLREAYGLPQRPVGIDHSLGYEAIAGGQIDVMDIYSTDAKIARYGLRVLADDRRYFPPYQAVLVYRLDVPQRFPQAWAALRALEGRIDARQMIAMNAAAELDGRPFSAIAADFLAPGAEATARATGWTQVLFGPDFRRLTVEHLTLVFASLAAAIAAGLPLGVWAARSRGAARPILAAVGVIQTVPALALLAFLIPLFGMIGTVPALAALFLYSLLPIVRGTHTGIAGIPPELIESADVLGLDPAARLRLIELPLASRSILGGIQTSAVISVGTATIAAFIGAGGYGERIVTGLALNDHGLLLAGAVPAAALALLVQGAFELIDRWLVPAGLRPGTGASGRAR